MDGKNTRSRKFDTQSSFNGGISDDNKKNLPNSYAFGRSVNVRSHSRQVSVLTKTSKESGSVVTDLPKWADRVNDIIYIHGDTGNIYSRTLAGSHALLRQVANSHGNGLKFYGEDNFLYYASDRVLGRYGPTDGTANFVDDYLGSEGGVPLNTYSIDLESGSSQYLSRADSASLSITGDLAIEAYYKPESLPTVGNSHTIVSKWDESGTLRSYMFDLFAISGFFGDGSSGALTISSNTTESPTDSACTGTLASLSLSATNAGFASGQEILIHQTRGSGAGTTMRNTIVSYTAGTITLANALNAAYITGAQVRVLLQYSAVTINSGFTYTAKAWDGTTGGILAFLCSGTITNNGTISGAGQEAYIGNKGGFRGGARSTDDGNYYFVGFQGEGTTGVGGARSIAANGSGGGGGSGTPPYMGGSGGGHATTASAASGSNGGLSSGSADLTSMTFGGGGGSGGGHATAYGGSGGNGGAIIFIVATTITLNSGSLITVNGGNGDAPSGNEHGGGGGGAGGSVLLKCQSGTLGTTLVTASGGTRATGGQGDGTNGSSGRVHIDYYTSFTGTTTPTIDQSQDNTLVTTTSYQLRLGISSTGLNTERLTKVVDITTALWYRLALSWDASSSTATFYIDGVSQGTATGALTAIHDNASDFHVGAYENSGGAKTGFMDGLVDDVRVWNTERTQSQLFSNKDIQVSTTSPGLVAYYKFNNDATDATSNANNLTASGSPTYTTTVPFSSPTARLDLDQALDTTGQTYALSTSIGESSTDRQEFIPVRDPQKSLEVNISAKGTTADWTLTVHDALNRVVASKTVLNAALPASGDFEFIFSDVWRPVLGQTYHFHLTVTNTTGTPAVVTTTTSDLNTADFHTYYQFLVTDTQYHPMENMINLLTIGNGRYLATWNGVTFKPHRLTLPAEYNIRCLAKWQGFLAIGCMRGTSVGSYDQGAIFFWDGISTTYNDYIEVPEGAINAMLGTAGTLYSWAGYQGDLLEYTGGAKARKKKRVPLITSADSMEIMPGAVTMWQTLLRFGAGVTNSNTVEQGVYTYGHLDDTDPMALSYDYPLSTGNRTNSNIQVGLVFPVEKKLLIGWKDNVSYGVDVIDPAGTTFSTARIERLRMDYGAVYKEKSVMNLRADLEPLITGQSVSLEYRLDRGSWQTGTVQMNEDNNVARLAVGKGRHKEIDVAINLSSTVSTAPILLELSFEEEVLASESAFNNG